MISKTRVWMASHYLQSRSGTVLGNSEKGMRKPVSSGVLSMQATLEWAAVRGTSLLEQTTGVVCLYRDEETEVADGESGAKKILKDGRHQNMFEFKGKGLSRGR